MCTHRPCLRYPAIVVASALSVATAWSAPTSDLSAAEIVRRSVKVNDADWNAQPNFTYREEETKVKEDAGGRVVNRQEKTYQVTMIDGTPHLRLIEMNHRPLGAPQNQEEESKLKRETAARANESASGRAQRLNKYKNERAEEKLLMQQMASAFRFTLAGEQPMDGVPCYVLDARPDPNYRPPVQRARVLPGMKGRLYIDKAGYHWVRVQAEVISPVEFGVFLAKVNPGTSFELEQAPLGNVWLPKRFVESVNATVLGVYGKRDKEEDLYSDYRPITGAS